MPNENRIPTSFVEAEQARAAQDESSHPTWFGNWHLVHNEPLFSSWEIAAVQWREGREDTLEDVEHIPIGNETV